MLNLLSIINSKLNTSWDKRIEDVRRFVEKNGHAAISTFNASEDLATWARGVRARYYNGELPKQHIDNLNSLGFVWDLIQYKWEKNIEGLKQFKDKDGFITSIKRTENKDYFYLSCSLRTKYRKGTLPKYKIDDLEAIGFVWEVEEHKWNIMYKKLVEYNKQRREAKENFRIAKPKSDELKLWLVVQSSKYNKGTLSEEKIELLKAEEVPFLVKKDSWMDGYNRYIKAINKPQGEKPDYVYNWVHRQRTLYSKGKLNDKQISLIKKLGISLVKSDGVFWERFDELVKYKEQHGNCRVVESKTPSKRLYSWYTNLRRQFDSLSEDKKEALLSIGYQKYTNYINWDKNIEIYKKIKNKPHAELSDEEYKVIKWSYLVKSRYKNGKYDEERRKQLEEIIIG